MSEPRSEQVGGPLEDYRLAKKIGESDWQRVFDVGFEGGFTKAAESEVVAGGQISDEIREVINEGVKSLEESKREEVERVVMEFIGESVLRSQSLLRLHPNSGGFYLVKEEFTEGSGGNRRGFLYGSKQGLSNIVKGVVEIDSLRKMGGGSQERLVALGRKMNEHQKVLVHETVHHVQREPYTIDEHVELMKDTEKISEGDVGAYWDNKMEEEARMIADKFVKRDARRLARGFEKRKIGFVNIWEMELADIVGFGRVEAEANYRTIEEKTRRVGSSG